MNDKMFKGLLNAPPEKRYKSCISQSVDNSEVWFLSNNEGYATFDSNEKIHLMVWPQKEFAEYMITDANETPAAVEIHDFCERCEEVLSDPNIAFMVFPTKKDAYIVEPQQLLLDLGEELELVE